MTEKTRREDRVEIFGKISIDYFSKGSNGAEGVVLNVSNYGAGIAMTTEVETGTFLRLRGNGIWNGVREGKVVWCMSVAPGIYAAGIDLL